ncbi:MAG TPA: STAS domain-containing protein [Acidimicrobiia bacterium]
MPSVPFSASVRLEDNATVIDLAGDIDRSAAPGLDQAYGEASEGPGRLILNFSDVEYINSTGIAVIVGVLAKARSARREVAGFGLSSHYREIFSITRLSDFMGIYDDEGAALAAAS